MRRANRLKKQLPLTSAMAATLMALPGCSSEPEWNGDTVAERDTQFCINQTNGQRADDEYCRSQGATGGYAGGGGGRGYQWYYMGRGSPLPYYGESIYDRRFEAHGSFQPRQGVNYGPAPVDTRMSRSEAVSRGGLGSGGRRYGGGWS